jgi:hypothetical protein
VTAAIKAAIDDIEQGNVKDFIRNMFPVNAQLAMFRQGVNRAPAAIVDKDAGIMELMLKDLKALQSLSPNIQQDVAEFTLPPVEFVEKPNRKLILPAGIPVVAPDRVIRFSKINGHWARLIHANRFGNSTDKVHSTIGRRNQSIVAVGHHTKYLE